MRTGRPKTLRPETITDKKRRHRYHLTQDEYDALLRSTDGLCEICRQPPGPYAGKPGVLQLDHCHKTGRVRGLLCHACNTSLGRMCDDPARLRAAAAYLERASQEVPCKDSTAS